MHDELHGATRARMLRELATVLDTLTADTPLVLVLEDLHWSDYATLDLLAFLARRHTPAQLLLLGTYRPVEVIVQEHPLWTVVYELQRQGHGREIPLESLSAGAVATYLTTHFPAHQFPDGLAEWLHQHTDGTPLFLVTLVASWVARGILTVQENRWRLTAELAHLAMEVPEGLRPLLEQQITRLAPAAQRVVEVASLAGVEFAAPDRGGRAGKQRRGGRGAMRRASAAGTAAPGGVNHLARRDPGDAVCLRSCILSARRGPAPRGRPQAAPASAPGTAPGNSVWRARWRGRRRTGHAFYPRSRYHPGGTLSSACCRECLTPVCECRSDRSSHYRTGVAPDPAERLRASAA